MQDGGPEKQPDKMVDVGGLEALLGALIRRGYELIGPVARDGAIVYDRVRSVADLPAGWADEQDAGTYRLRRRDDQALFGFSSSPQSWKKLLFPPSLRLFRAQRTPDGFTVADDTDPTPRYAFIGVRACDLGAIAVQARVFTGGAQVDPTYQERQQAAFVVAVNCGQAAKTCFCTSMKTGPKAQAGFDLALTEILEPGRHEFLVEVGTERGRELMVEISGRAANDADHDAAAERVRRAEEQMGRRLDTDGIKELLFRNLEHPRWDDVATRCLTCANCTMVCPTCFCSNVEDVTDLTGDNAERWRKWDSCFTQQHSHIHGGSVRTSTRSRYRQWLTHKLGTWIDQFGSSGCVGCGRCIAWCPVGIDITEEMRAIRETDGAHGAAADGRDTQKRGGGA